MLATVLVVVAGGRGRGTVSLRGVRRPRLLRRLGRGGVAVLRWCLRGGVGKRVLGRGIRAGWRGDTAGGASIVDAGRGGVRGALGTNAIEMGRIVGGMIAFRSRRGGMRVGVRKSFVLIKHVGSHGGAATN